MSTARGLLVGVRPLASAKDFRRLEQREATEEKFEAHVPSVWAPTGGIDSLGVHDMHAVPFGKMVKTPWTANMPSTPTPSAARK
jgi:hypothetical protein